MNEGIHLHERTHESRRYVAPAVVSQETFPLKPGLFLAQWISVSIIIFVASLIFIEAPLMQLHESVGGETSAITIFVMIYIILILLYAIYFHAWMKKYQFHFFENYIETEAGVFRRSEKHIQYSTIYRVCVRRGMFERAFGLASVYIENGIGTGSPEGEGSEPASLIIPGQSIESAYRMVEIIESILHGRGGEKVRLKPRELGKVQS